MINTKLLPPAPLDLLESKNSGEDYEHNYKKTNKRASKDWDRDGEVEDDADEYAGVKDNAIKANKKTSKLKKENCESYSDWRSELGEQLNPSTDTGFDPKIDDPKEVTKPTEGQVKKNPKIRNTIIINPTIQEEIENLQHEHLELVLEFVVDHFSNLGYSGGKVIDIIEDIGELEFYEYVLNMMSDVIYESHVSKRKFSPMNLNVIKEYLTTCILDSEFCEWVQYIVNEGLEFDINDLRKYYFTEKAVSQSQQKLFGLALAVKRGEVPRSQVSKDILDIIDTMSSSEIRKFAKTKRSQLPEIKK